MEIIREGLEFVLSHPDDVAAFGSLIILSSAPLIQGIAEGVTTYISKRRSNSSRNIHEYLGRSDNKYSS